MKLEIIVKKPLFFKNNSTHGSEQTHNEKQITSSTVLEGEDKTPNSTQNYYFFNHVRVVQV